MVGLDGPCVSGESWAIKEESSTRGLLPRCKTTAASEINTTIMRNKWSDRIMEV